MPVYTVTDTNTGAKKTISTDEKKKKKSDFKAGADLQGKTS